MLRVTAIWSGFSGAPGYSNFYFSEPAVPGPSAQVCANGVREFFRAVSSALPDIVRIDVQPVVGQVEPGSGQLTGEIVVGETPAQVAGTSGGQFSAVSGCVVGWVTKGIANGRRIRGRTFLVPLSGNAYGNDGTLSSLEIDGLRGAAQGLVNLGGLDFADFAVWRRPVNGAGGSMHTVSGSIVRDQVAVLRSRRT